MDANDARLIVGSGDGAELLLADALVQPLHAEITYDDGQLFVKSLGGRTFLNGKLLRGENPTAIGDFQFVTVGVTHMLVGPADGEWPQHGADSVPALEIEGEEVPQEIIAKADLTAEPSVLRAAREQVERAHRKKKRIRILAVCCGILLAVLLAVLLVPKKKQPSAADLEKTIRSQLASMEQFPAVAVRVDRGQVTVDGYVPTNIDLKDLRTMLQAAYPAVHCAVRSQEKILVAIEELLRSVDGKFRVTPMQPGSYSIGGYVYDSEGWQKTRSRLSADVPGIRKIQNDVLTPDRVLSMAQEVLARHGLARQITILPESSRVYLQGKISALQLEQWKMAAEELIQTFSDLVSLEFDVQTLSAQTETSVNAFFPQPIQSITVSSNGLCWVATGDGRKYFTGSFLPSGWRVDAIATDGLSLSREGRRINMRLEALR